MAPLHEPLYGNIGAELDRMFPGDNGFSDHFSNIGFWGGGPALGTALDQFLEQQEGKRKARTATDVANINAGSQANATMADILKSIMQNRTGAASKLAELDSNRELQEALKKLGYEELRFKEGQHNLRSDKALAERARTNDALLGLRERNVGANVPFDQAMGQARKEIMATNPKAAPEEIRQKAVEIMQGAKRTPMSPGTPPPAPTNGDFMKQEARQKLSQADLPDVGNIGMAGLVQSGGGVADTMFRDNPERQLTKDTPQVAGSVRGAGYPSDRSAPDPQASTYYASEGAPQGSAAFGGDYNPKPTDRGVNPMAKFQTAEYMDPALLRELSQARSRGMKGSGFEVNEPKVPIIMPERQAELGGQGVNWRAPAPASLSAQANPEAYRSFREGQGYYVPDPTFSDKLKMAAAKMSLGARGQNTLGGEAALAANRTVAPPGAEWLPAPGNNTNILNSDLLAKIAQMFNIPIAPGYPQWSGR